jgi:hypothetical protein
MAKNTVKAEVHINDPEWDEDVSLLLNTRQATAVLDALISGQPLRVHLFTDTEKGRPELAAIQEDPKAYAS